MLDDGSELMASAILAVVLVEALAARHPARPADRDTRGLLQTRWATGAVLVALLGASGPALLAQWDWEEAGWTRPLRYAGPISHLEQALQTHVGQLTRIDVWGYVDGGDGTTATAVICPRLIPHEGGPSAIWGWGLARVRRPLNNWGTAEISRAAGPRAAPASRPRLKVNVSPRSAL